MGKIVMPKNSALLNEIEAVLKIYYESDTWISNDEYKRKLKDIIGDDQYSSSYTKKAQITSYFGFTIWEDITNPQSKRKITPTGKLMYEAITTNNTNQIQELLMNALETVVFGRDNFGCPESDSDIEAPSLFIRGILDLGYLTYKEFAYLLWKLVDIGGNYTDSIKEIKRFRNQGQFDLDAEAQKYTDAKPIMILIRWGFLDEQNDPKGIIVKSEVLEKYDNRLRHLKIYNVDKFYNPDAELSPYVNPKGIGYNKIYYGVPGCGKSYHVEHEVLKGIPKEKIVRTTFYLDYSNSDFVGQIYPIINNDVVSYEPVPGPFTKALELAYGNPNEMMYLVIEEINRGNAAAIFGDLFQLLDRLKKDYDGRIAGDSEYPVSNGFIEDYFTKKGINYVTGKIYIPHNLTILATMNTSDQNVFPLDTAFKRRWQRERVISKWDNTNDIKDLHIPGTSITWKQFAKGINKMILKNSESSSISEDKCLGSFFASKNMLLEQSDNSIELNYNKLVAFVNNVIDYLYNDVTKFNHKIIFKDTISSYESLYNDMISVEYKTSGNIDLSKWFNEETLTAIEEVE